MLKICRCIIRQHDVQSSFGAYKWKWDLLEKLECSRVESESEKWKLDLLEKVECSGVEKESSEEKSRNGSNDEIDCAGHLGWMALVVCYPFLLVFFVINFYWCYLRWLVVIIFYWFLSLLIVLWAPSACHGLGPNQRWCCKHKDWFYSTN